MNPCLNTNRSGSDYSFWGSIVRVFNMNVGFNQNLRAQNGEI